MKHIFSLAALVFPLLSFSQCVDESLINTEAICPAIYAPVCGCNGVTYSNSCEAQNYGGVTEWTEGECQPVSECLDLVGIDFGPCFMWLGYAYVNGTCASVSGCGYIVNDMDYSPYFFEDNDACIASCGQVNECMDVEGIDFGLCDMWLGYAYVNGTCASVSGCGYIVDDIDYSPYFFEDNDACIASCGEVNECMDVEGIDFGPCFMWLGYAYVDGTCASVSGCGYIVDDIDYSPYFFEDNDACIASCGQVNECMDVEGIDFGPCFMWLGYAYVDGTCASVSGCGYIVDDIDYSPYFFEDNDACIASCGQVNECMDVEGIDFGLCAMWLGYALVGGTCTNISGCGYVVDDVDYSPAFHPNLSECFLACGETQDCVNQWQQEAGELIDCIGEYNPVCGCDGITYANSCIAFYTGGVVTYAHGACSETEENCQAIPAAIDFGDCEMVLGYAFMENGCVMTSGCSYVGNNGYDYSAYFFDSEYECVNSCIDEVVIECIDESLINPLIFCPTVYVPVCGCDGNTYPNDCVAQSYNGVTSWTVGECPTTSVGKNKKEELSVYPNPFQTTLNISVPKIFKVDAITIYDLAGKAVCQQRVTNQEKQTIDVAEISCGMYILECKSATGEVLRKQITKQ